MPLWDAAAGLLSGGSSLGNLGAGGSSSAAAGPVSAGPVVVNVAGFGSKSSGSASSSARDFPAAGGTAYSDETGMPAMPSWVLPAAGVALVLVLALSIVKR